ncbi:MAG: ribonuclease HI [Gammaproteobacteria bacterium]|nr:ribonuclease HI [Gammaproteobacteria bacterium]
MQERKHFTVYTDGSIRGNPDGPGGWAFVGKTPDGHKFEDSGGDMSTTNNRMEMMAAIQAMEYIHSTYGPSKVLIVTDSQYLCEGATEWILNWVKHNWRNSSGSPVANKDLWLRIQKAHEAHEAVKWKWCRGHTGIPGNEMADKLAKAAVPEGEKDVQRYTVSVYEVHVRNVSVPATSEEEALTFVTGMDHTERARRAPNTRHIQTLSAKRWEVATVKLMYAIGTEHAKDEYGMWAGPNPSMEDMLAMVGTTDQDFIFELGEDGEQHRIFRWNKKRVAWIPIGKQRKKQA